MKLYYAPGVCSIGIHVLLEEIGKPYDLEAVNLREGAQYQPGYTKVSPKSKVPALERDDGSILTEFPVIATYLAVTNPEKKLVPSDTETALRGYEAMEYAVGTMHGQGFARIFRPGNFGPADQEDAVKARAARWSKRVSRSSTRRSPARNTSAATSCRSPTPRCSMSSSGPPPAST